MIIKIPRPFFVIHLNPIMTSNNFSLNLPHVMFKKNREVSLEFLLTSRSSPTKTCSNPQESRWDSRRYNPNLQKRYLNLFIIFFLLMVCIFYHKSNKIRLKSELFPENNPFLDNHLHKCKKNLLKNN